MQTDLQQDEKTILIIDDDPEISELIGMFLKLERYNVIYSLTGLGGIELVRSNHVDLVLLDIGLPDVSGQQICKLLRQETDLPIIMLSANDSVSDKVICLEYGADDYITKPFENMEMIARVKAVLRRAEKDRKEALEVDSDTEVNFHGIVIDFSQRHALIKGKNLNLTPKEFDLLVYFSKHPGKTLLRDKIIEDLWGKNTLYRWSRSLDVHIQNLRQKIEHNPKNPSIIQTVSGVGYRVKAKI